MELQNNSQCIDNGGTPIGQLGADEFMLPIGYKDVDGTIHRIVKLTPMTGETEEALSNPKIKENGGKLITELIHGVVESLGELKKVSKDVIRALTVVDRDYIIAMNKKVSFGTPLVDFPQRCPHCGSDVEVEVDLDTLPVKYFEHGKDSMTTNFELPIGIKGSDGIFHKNITITLPTGIVQERVAPIARVNEAQATTALLQAITVKIEGLDFVDQNTFKKMTKRDRDFLSKKLTENAFGISLIVDSICSECGETFQTAVPLDRLMGE